MRKFWYLTALSLFILVMAFPIAVFAQDGGTIVYDQVVTGEITNDTYEIPYQFEGRAGEIILVEMNATSDEPRLDSYVRLLAPNGDELHVDDDGGGNLNSLLGPFTLPEDGTYTVVATRFQLAEGTSTGTYELVVKLAQITPLFLNERITIALDADNNYVFYEYTASENGIFDIRTESIIGDGGVSVTATDEEGNYLNGFFIAPDTPTMTTPLILSAGDQVLFNIRREPNYYGPGVQQPATGTIRFDMTLLTVNPVAVAFGETLSGTLNDQNPVAYYSFDGSAGDLIGISGERINGDFEILLIDALGRQFNGSATAYAEGRIMLDPITLSTTGTHLIVLRRMLADGSGNVVGVTSDYALTLSMTQTPLLESGVEIIGSVDPDNGVYEQVFRLEGTEGQTVRITLRSVDDIYVPGMDVQSAQVATAMYETMGMGGGGGGGSDFFINFNATEPGTMTYEFTVPSTTVYIFHVRGGYGPNGPLGGEFGLTVEVIE